MLRSPRGQDIEGQRRKCRRALGKYPNVGKSREKEDLEDAKGIPRGSCRRGHQEKTGKTKKPKLPKQEGPEEEPREGLRESTGLQRRVWKQRRRGSTRNRKGRPR